jgi:hypothetical protein
MARKLYWAYVSFADHTGGKERPVLYVRQNDEFYYVYRLTSKYATKSPEIQKQYFEILDWREAGLEEPTWIDRGRVNKLPKATTRLGHIGELSSRDVKRLAEFKVD